MIFNSAQNYVLIMTPVKILSTFDLAIDFVKMSSTIFIQTYTKKIKNEEKQRSTRHLRHP